MNREIKYRGKDLIHNNWIYGGLAYDKENNAVILPRENWQKGGCVDKDTICQYTGVADANFTDIYEGDIVTDGSNRKYVIFYSDINLCFERCPVQHYKSSERERETFSQPITFENWYKIKRYVIGNIFDNPNLLE